MVRQIALGIEVDTGPVAKALSSMNVKPARRERPGKSRESRGLLD
jgi:hypothetical protein